MGSDTRDGAGNNIDGLTGDGQRSDTTIMFHLSADRSFAYGVSIPRDSLVDRPDCLDANGNAIPGADDAMWNEAFSIGGPACTMQQFEHLTGVRLDNYVEASTSTASATWSTPSAAWRSASPRRSSTTSTASTSRPAPATSRARRRSTTCAPATPSATAPTSAASSASRPSSRRWRARCVSAGTLTRVDRMVGFLNAATSSLQPTSPRSGRSASLLDFKNVGLDNIRFVTVPWQYSPADPNRVEWLPEADRLWERVINDKPIGGRIADGVIKATDDVDGKPAKGSNKRPRRDPGRAGLGGPVRLRPT